MEYPYLHGSEDGQINIKDLEGYDSEESDPYASSDSSSSVSDSRDSQCNDNVIVLSSEDNDETLLQMSTVQFISITNKEIFHPFLWLNYTVDISQHYLTIG